MVVRLLVKYFMISLLKYIFSKFLLALIWFLHLEATNTCKLYDQNKRGGGKRRTEPCVAVFQPNLFSQIFRQHAIKVGRKKQEEKSTGIEWKLGS